MPVLHVICGERQADLPFTGQPVLSDLLTRHGFLMEHPCGGRGVCGKCAVSLYGETFPANEAERRMGTRLSCQTVLLGDCTVVLPSERTMEQIEGGESEVMHAHGNAALAAAVDVGTTTLALRLFDLRTRERLASATAVNPQTALAADVMGRIDAAIHGSAELLQKQILDAIEALLAQACAAACCDAARVTELVIAGNTAMLYLLTGRAPDDLAYAPFHAEQLFGCREELRGRNVYLPPCIHAFVGADITCAVLASRMCRQWETTLLCDIGTNGEMALWKDGVLYVTSTAAGPAFEGAGITQGCGSVRGAIDRVRLEKGGVVVHTLGDASAIGICGSGLIDAVAVMLRLGRIDETGAMTEESIPLAEGVALYPRDVRNVQLAKAAIAAGMETLMKEANVEAEKVDKLYVAGGFGNHLNLQSAVDLGLIPAVLMSRTTFIGNGSLQGASELLRGAVGVSEAEAIAGRARHVELGGQESFNQAYMEQLMFPPVL